MRSRGGSALVIGSEVWRSTSPWNPFPPIAGRESVHGFRFLDGENGHEGRHLPGGPSEGTCIDGRKSAGWHPGQDDDHGQG